MDEKRIANKTAACDYKSGTLDSCPPWQSLTYLSSVKTHRNMEQTLLWPVAHFSLDWIYRGKISPMKQIPMPIRLWAI